MKHKSTKLLSRSKSLEYFDESPIDESPPAADFRRKSICVPRLNPESRRGSRCDTIHSSRAGSLCYYRHRKRNCFIEQGFVKQALERLVVRNYGDDVWDQISRKIFSKSRERLESEFLSSLLNDDQLAFDIVETASQIIKIPKCKIWEMFGEMFFEFCEESGYDKILQVLGGTLMEFLQNLDALHDHLSTIYPGMRTPSFRCLERKDGSILLHFQSDREGLEYIVVGLVKSVARELHSKEVNVEIVSNSEFNDSYIQFLITEKTCSDSPLSPGPVPSHTRLTDDYGGLIGNQPLISPQTFCKLLPFHVIFNRRLKVTQVGNSLSRVIPEIDEPRYTMKSLFEIYRPCIEFNFDMIVQHSSAVFVVRVKPNKIRKCPMSGSNESLEAEEPETADRSKLRLKGQMLYIPESDLIAFLCSPYISNLEDLHERGLYLSDIPVHDATRDLVLLSEQFRAEYELTQRLETMTERLQQTYKELEIEKQLTDKLVYSILPPSVANELRVGHAVEAVKYDLITLLFSGLCDFNEICERSSPRTIVDLLNDLYTKFDMISDPKVYNVYKVETAGDKYLVASGLPEWTSSHARNIALLALEMVDIAKEIVINGIQVKLAIGIHTGEAVAGVIGQKLPRYCVFGDTVNIASRMETHSEANSINVSEVTQRYLQESENFDPTFEFKERGPIKIKGKTKPIICYYLTRKPRNLPALQMLLESGLVIRDPDDPAPIDLLQRRRRSETLFRFHEMPRSNRRLSDFPCPPSPKPFDIPTICVDSATTNNSD
ncbi:guanylate cyclase soluble subunit beta-1-like [Tubulanus polymorphus]|uniref:guanylate cyclase soluble subunit beta-1-like n=1 Tax=Tubulanus polymorphus TaxID=672921 RepID=UPI003DA29EE8